MTAHAIAISIAAPTLYAATVAAFVLGVHAVGCWCARRGEGT